MSDYQARPQDEWPAQPTADGAGRWGYDAGYGDSPGSHQQEAHARPAGRPPRRRRGHPLVWLLVVLVVLLAIAGIGDQVAKTYAQNDIATQVQQSGLSVKPSVHIAGWPFLTQIAAHDLKTVNINANNVTASGSKVAFNFTATATGVHLNSSFNGGTVDHINGQALLPFSSVAGLLPLSGATVSADPADGPNEVKADLGVGTVTGIVKLSGSNEIVIRLNSASGLPSALGSVSGNTFTINIPKLPAGLVVQSVNVTSQGIVATATASNTSFSQ